MNFTHLKRVHLAVGVTGVLAFLATGQFMDRSLAHLRGMSDGPRALYRSGHIYILFAALLNMLLGVYLTAAGARGARIVQCIGSAALMIAVALFLYGFAIETPLAMIERPMVRKGIVWCLAGVAAHAVAMLVPVPTISSNGVEQ